METTQNQQNPDKKPSPSDRFFKKKARREGWGEFKDSDVMTFDKAGNIVYVKRPKL